MSMSKRDVAIRSFLFGLVVGQFIQLTVQVARFGW